MRCMYQPVVKDLVPWHISHTGKPHYQIFVDCTYWPMLGNFKNWNIINFTNKTAQKEDFDDINKFVLDEIIKKLNNWYIQVSMVM